MIDTTNIGPQVDSNGHGPRWKAGDRVWVAPLKMEATVVEQLLSWDYPESFWGNVVLRYDDGANGISNNWQLVEINR